MFRIESVTLIYYLVMFNIKLSLSLLSATDIPKPFALVVCSINIYSTEKKLDDFSAENMTKITTNVKKGEDGLVEQRSFVG